MVEPEPTNPARRARRAIVFLTSLSVALTLAVVFLALRPRGDDAIHPGLLRDERVQEAAVAELVAGTTRMFDSHPDATVSRVLLPNLDRVPYRGTTISSNAFGMRERAYELPKPAGLTRLVLLGDSFVFGLGVEAEVRLGVFLEERLRAAGARAVEVLHLGIGSWNTLAECAFVHRQLDALDPDLVVQVFVSNDLDDNAGVRGFGVRSDFDPAHPERASGRVFMAYPRNELGAGDYNPLLLGLDGESRARMDASLEAIARLAADLEARGARYLMLDAVGGAVGKAWFARLRERLAEDRLLLLDPSFMGDPQLRVGHGDPHWNAAGHEQVARLLHAVIQERGLLPELELARWAEAPAVIEERHGVALENLESSELPGFDPGPELKRPNQIYGGLDRERRAAPYASFVLAPGGRTRLVLAGRFLGAPEMAGGVVHVRIDGEPVHRFTMEPGASFEERVGVPRELAGRGLVAVQLVADTWALTGRDGRECVSYFLESARFEP